MEARDFIWGGCEADGLPWAQGRVTPRAGLADTSPRLPRDALRQLGLQKQASVSACSGQNPTHPGCPTRAPPQATSCSVLPPAWLSAGDTELAPKLDPTPAPWLTRATSWAVTEGLITPGPVHPMSPSQGRAPHPPSIILEHWVPSLLGVLMGGGHRASWPRVGPLGVTFLSQSPQSWCVPSPGFIQATWAGFRSAD